MSAAIVLHGNFQLSVIFNYLNASTSSGVSGIFLPKTGRHRFPFIQIVFFIAISSEVAVFFHFIIIDEVFKLLLSFPKVYQFGDKVNARLNGYVQNPVPEEWQDAGSYDQTAYS